MRIRLAIFAFTILAHVCVVAQDSRNTPASPAGTITGSGSTGYVPKFTGSLNIADSVIFQSATGNVGIGTTTPAAKLHVNGAINAVSFEIGGTPFAFGSVSKNNALLGFSGNLTMTGTFNTGSGANALFTNTTGSFNTAAGFQALYLNQTGNVDTAVGAYALGSNVGGSDNAALGLAALYSNSTGSQNTATGDYALTANTTANLNTASGYQSLMLNSSGYENTAVGAGALSENTLGYYNTAIGRGALSGNTTGALNTAVGFLAEVGSGALINATAIGAEATVTASNSLVLGTSLSYNGMANTNVGIDVTAPSNIFTVLQGGGNAIADGWSTYSSRRWKTNIQTLRGALGQVERLRGVTYDLKSNGQHEIGVIAEEVAEVVPEVVSLNKDSKDAQGVDYGRLTALLIEAMKEQQVIIRKQQEQIQAQGEQIKTQQTKIDSLASRVDTLQVSLETGGRADTIARSVTPQSSAARR
jgi:hypothetical protein